MRGAMSVRNLKLGQLTLVHNTDDLELSVATSGAFSLPLGLSSLGDHELRETLASGNIWITRGRACRVNIQISFNGRALDESIRLRVLESLGYQCRDAHLWTQLSLKTSLDIPLCDSVSSSNLCIFLKYANSPAVMNVLFQGWPLDEVDVKPPDVVGAAIFQQLVVNLDFYTSRKDLQSLAKRRKQNSQSQDTEPSSSAASRSQLHENNHTHAQAISPPLLSKEEISTGLGHQPIRAPNGRFSFWIVTILERWASKHENHPWPTNEQKLELMKQTGLKRDQINRWMGSYRKRRNNDRKHEQTSDHSDEMLLSQSINEKIEDDDDLLFLSMDDRRIAAEELLLSLDSKHPEANQEEAMLLQPEDGLLEEEMMLHPSGVATPSLTSASTINSQPLTNSDVKKHQLAIASGETSQTVSALNITLASHLTSAAFLTIVSGRRCTQDIRIEISEPPTSLSSIIPTMFCPGFRQLMAHNGKFLGGICSAVTSSWTRNAQGRALKNKLQELSEVQVSLGVSQSRKSTLEETLSPVVQSRMWRMMQRALNDSSSGRTLLWEKAKSDETGVSERSDNQDSTAEPSVNLKSSSDFESLLETEGTDDDEEETLEMLLWERENGSDDGLLDYLDELERQAIEEETEEMLYGCQDVFEMTETAWCIEDDASDHSDCMLV